LLTTVSRCRLRLVQQTVLRCGKDGQKEEKE